MKQALRRFTLHPGATIGPVIMLGVGIGLTTAMFALVDTLVFTPVPFDRPDELATVYMAGEHGGHLTVSPAVLRAWRESPAFTHVESAHSNVALIETGSSHAVRPVAWVTPGLFSMLGSVHPIRPVRGRLFEPGEGRAGSDDRVLLSESVWRGVFDADESIVGRRVRINEESVLVVGILPADFRFPAWNTGLWRPIDFDALPLSQTNLKPTAYARFAANIPRTDAQRLATESARAADAANAELQATVRPIVTLETYDRRAVPLLTGGVVFVFLVLCINVCGLLLTRVSDRRRELGIRAALGASPGRLMWEAFVESAALSALGIIAGVMLAGALVQLFRALLPETQLMHTLNPPNLDARALAVTAVCGVVATLTTGLWPAWFGGRVNAVDTMRAADRGGTDTRGGRLVTRVLSIAEIALACMLLLTATLLVRSFINLVRVDRGLNTSGVVTATLTLPRTSFPDRAARNAAATVLGDAIRQMPGVRRVAWSYGIPPEGGAISFGPWTSDASGVGSRGIDLPIDHYYVGADFFALYGIPILRGRTFQATDGERDVIVGERLAQRLWPDVDPIGGSFGSGQERYRVIGMVREIHYPSLDSSLDRPEFYVRLDGISSYATLSVQCDGRCPDEGTLRQRLQAGHAGVTVADVRPLEEVYLEQLARPRAAAGLGVIFAATSLLVAGGGLFCLLTVAVGRRRREFGIRVALGASPTAIRRLVWREGLLVIGVGSAVGAAGALSIARVIAALQYGVAIHDPLTWSVVLAVLAAVAAAASWRPMRDASRIDPLQLLKQE